MTSQVRCHTWLLDNRCWRLNPNGRDWTPIMQYSAKYQWRRILGLAWEMTRGRPRWCVPEGGDALPGRRTPPLPPVLPSSQADAMSMCDRVKVKHWGWDVVDSVSGARVDSCVSRCFLSQCPCVSRLWGTCSVANSGRTICFLCFHACLFAVDRVQINLLALLYCENVCVVNTFVVDEAKDTRKDLF